VYAILLFLLLVNRHEPKDPNPHEEYSQTTQELTYPWKLFHVILPLPMSPRTMLSPGGKAGRGLAATCTAIQPRIARGPTSPPSGGIGRWLGAAEQDAEANDRAAPGKAFIQESYTKASSHSFQPLAPNAPSGIRIRVATLKGWCPSPLDDGGPHLTIIATTWSRVKSAVVAGLCHS
jgi:hypothetical protein